MRWRKRGNIFDPRAHRDWAGSHAQVPTVLVKEDRLRIFYADRTAQNQSFTTYLDVDRRDPSRVLYLHKRPILPFGRPGTFDDDGVMPAFVLERQKRVYLYYNGWNRRVTVPFHNATGLAVSDDGGATFTRLFEGPVLDRVPLEPYIAVTPCLLRDRDGEGDVWRMWYSSGVDWVTVGGKLEAVYVIKYAHSRDGIHWERPNLLSVPPRHPGEAFSHPSVIESGGLYRMWYCYRDSADYHDGAGSYRIGYAESRTGVEFERKDAEAGIAPSDEGGGWDSTMICYPYVIAVDGETYMFYNGNGFGQSGIGYAVLEEGR
jgi:hypothetical protein